MTHNYFLEYRFIPNLIEQVKQGRNPLQSLIDIRWMKETLIHNNIELDWEGFSIDVYDGSYNKTSLEKGKYIAITFPPINSVPEAKYGVIDTETMKYYTFESDISEGFWAIGSQDINCHGLIKMVDKDMSLEEFMKSLKHSPKTSPQKGHCRKSCLAMIVLALAIVWGIVCLCSCSYEQKKPVNRWWVPEKKDVISWEKLDTIVVGDGLFKLKYPDCFELEEELDDSSVTASYKGIPGLFLMANAEKNPYHWDVDTLADFVVRDRKAEGNDSIVMRDMHDGYFYLKGIMGSSRSCFYEQFVVYHDSIYRLTLVYPSNMETKMENLFRLVHDWHPETHEMFRTKKSYITGERMSILKKVTGAHDYREFYIEERDYACNFMVYDSRHHSRYGVDFHDGLLNDGAQGMYAFVSPDQRYIYVVGDIMDNGLGRLSTFRIYQVNTETLRVRFVNEAAGVRLEKNGFTVASATRCVTPGAEYTYQMDFNFVDITYGFNGKIKGVSKEYSSKRFRKRYGKNLINIQGLVLPQGQDD